MNPLSPTSNVRLGARLRAAFAFAAALALAAAPMALLQGCLEGTESGTETGIEGRLSRDNDEGAPGAEVYAFRTETGDSALLLRILENPDTLRDGDRFHRATADDKGRYRLLGLDPGYYAVIGFFEETMRRGKWVGFRPTLKVEPSAMTDAGNLTLARIGGITAQAVHKGAPAENVKCHIPGYSFVAYTDSAGRCMLLHVPEGSHEVRFEHPDFTLVKRTNVNVESGKITPIVEPVILVRSPSGKPPAPRNPTISLDGATRIVTLSWDSVEVSDLAGYILFRKPSDSLSAVLEIPLHNNFIRAQAYRDTLYKSLPDTAAVQYVYKLVAVDLDGIRSDPTVFPPLDVPAGDPARVAFIRAAFDAKEGEASALAWVRRTGPVFKPVTVQWTLKDSTAKVDSDYVAQAGEIRFAAGDTLKPLYAILADDNRVEAPEAFQVALHGPDNGALLADPRRAVFRVADDDSLTRIVCPTLSYAVSEGDSQVALSIRREGDKVRKAAFRYQAKAGTAAEGNDFASSSGTLTFDSGATALRLVIRIVNDTVEEKPERFTVSLSDPSRDVDLARCPEMAVDILDNDTNYVPVAVDFTKASSATYNAWRPDPRGFPGALYDGDTVAAALLEYKTTNADLLPKPQGHWDFKDCGKSVIPDLAGNGHDGDASTATLACVSDADGQWARFSGEDSVVVPANPGLDFREALTVAAWVRPDSMDGRHTVVARMYAPTTFAIELVDSLWVFTTVIHDGTWEGVSYHLNSPVAGAPNAWTHVAGTYDGEVQRLYVNGERVAEQRFKGRINITDRTLVIGNHPVWSPWHGGIREVKVFGTALNAWQVWEQMKLAAFPAKPLAVTFTFPQVVKVLGAGMVVGGSLGTTKYGWTLTAANSVADLDARSGSYAEVAAADNQGMDAWSRAGFKLREFKVWRYTVKATAGTGMVQINEVSLTGAERAKLGL